MQAPHPVALALLGAALLLAARLPAAEEPLATEIRAQHQRLRTLLEEAPKLADKAQQVAALRSAIRHAAWLEQVAGMQQARLDQLTALARLEVLGVAGSPCYGFLGEASGDLLATFTVRQALAGELPPALGVLPGRIFFLQLQNHSQEVLALEQGPFFVRRNLLGEVRREPLCPGSELPFALRSFEESLAWPSRLDPGDLAIRLAWISDQPETCIGMSLELREVKERGSLPRILRVPFPEAVEPEVFRALVKREAESAETWAKAAQEKKPAALPAPAPVPPGGAGAEAEAGPPPKPPEELPPALGFAEAAGSGDQIQIRINAGVKLSPGEFLRVRKGGAWVGYVRIPQQILGMAQHGSAKTVYWVTLFSGTRGKLAGGTLHREEPGK